MAMAINSKKLNKDRAIGAEVALIAVQKRVYKLLRETADSNKKQEQLVATDVLAQIIDMRSTLASLYVGNNRRIKHGRD